jgi:energy-coupling factor transporter ATP-binding protein EcfA2
MDPISSQGGGEGGQSRQPKPSPDSGGIHIGDVGGDVNFSALGDIVGRDKITTITTTIQISVEAVTQRPLVTSSPYRGLDRFEDRDKDLFFGRDQLIKSLLAQLGASNVLLVLGASGSGKSSVVRAGLLPQLSQLIGARFRYFTFVPDVNPFESLRSSLQGAGFSQAQTRELTDAQPETPAKLIATLQRASDQWLFFVDQFEEIFTVSDEKLRAHFIAALTQIAQDRNSSTKLVLAMRADFLDRFSPFPQFAKIIEKHIDIVADMHADELRQAIEQPAARHGVVFEQGLVEEIIKDVQGQAGSLPLLQYTLDLLWQEEARGDGLADRHLNTKAYRDLGGVRGALQKRANEIYSSFGEGADTKTPSPKQEIVRQIFLRLVDLAGEGANDASWRPVRRRTPISLFGTEQEREILRALIDQKLLVSNREGEDATVAFGIGSKPASKSSSRKTAWLTTPAGGSAACKQPTWPPMKNCSAVLAFPRLSTFATARTSSLWLAVCPKPKCTFSMPASIFAIVASGKIKRAKNES